MLTVSIKDKTFENGLTLFKDVNITFPKYGVIAFFGPSGCGKTTLAKMIANIDQEYDGKITGNRSVTYIDSNVHLFDELTVNDHLKLIETDPPLMVEPLNAFGLNQEANKKAKVLSIGQRKRLALLLALHAKSRILILDEISSGLDHEIRDAIMAYVIKYSTNHLVIWISHDEYEIDYYMDGVIDFTKLPLMIQRINHGHTSVPFSKVDHHYHPWLYIKSKWITIMVLTILSVLLVIAMSGISGLISSTDQTTKTYDTYNNGSTMIMSYPLHNDPIEGQINFYYDYPVFNGNDLMQWMADDPSLWGVVARTSTDYEIMTIQEVDGQTTTIKPFGDREMTSIYRTFYHDAYGMDAPNYPYDAPFVLEKPLDQYLGPDYTDKSISGYSGQDHTTLNQLDIIHLNPSLDSLPLVYGSMPMGDHDVIIDQKLAQFLIDNDYGQTMEGLVGTSFPIYMNDYEKHSSLVRGLTKETFEQAYEKPSLATMEMVNITGILEYPLGDHYVVFTNTAVACDPLSQHYYYDTKSSVFPEIMLFYDPTIDIQEKLDYWNDWLDHDGGVFVTMDHDHVEFNQDYRDSNHVWLLNGLGCLITIIMIVITYLFAKRRLSNDSRLLKSIGYNRKKIKWIWIGLIMGITMVISIGGYIIVWINEALPLISLMVISLSIFGLTVIHSILIHQAMKS